MAGETNIQGNIREAPPLQPAKIQNTEISSVPAKIDETIIKKRYLIISLAIIMTIGIIIGGYFLFADKELSSGPESIKDILAKAGDISSVQYETTLISVIPSDSLGYITSRIDMEIWQSGSYARVEATELNETTVMIFRPDQNYLYSPVEDVYLAFGKGEVIEKVQGILYINPIEIIENLNLNVIGSETIDGKLTTVIEYNTQIGEVDYISKLWIWNDEGIPIKSVTTFRYLLYGRISDLGGNYTQTYKNFKFDDINKEFFEVDENKIVSI